MNTEKMSNHPPTLFADQKPTTKIFAIAGGKGGIGKTVLTASLGAGLAALGKRVVLVDADFGGANLHTCLGVLEPERTFYDFFSFEVETLAELLLDTPVANLKLISGACGTLGLANPRYTQKLRFIRELTRLPGDYVLMDLGAGSSKNVLDYFLACRDGIVITMPDPMALQECFNFIKLALLRKLGREFAEEPVLIDAIRSATEQPAGRMTRPLPSVFEDVRRTDRSLGVRVDSCLAGFRPRLILNRVTGSADVQEGLAICTAARELLGIEVDFLGPIADDPAVRWAVKEFRPFLLEDTSSPASNDLAKLIGVKFLELGTLRGLWTKRKIRKAVEAEAQELGRIDFSAESTICSCHCFYWSDCAYREGGQPCQVRRMQRIFSGQQEDGVLDA